MKIFFFFSFILLLIIGILTFTFPFSAHEQKILKSESYFQNEKENYSQSVNFFEKEERDKNYELTYGWKDYEGNIYYFSFAISKEQVRKAEEEFGYYPNKLKKYLGENSEKMIKIMMKDLKDFVRKEIKKSKYSKYIYIEEIGEKSFKIKYSPPINLQKEVKSEYQRIINELKIKQSFYLKQITKELKKRRKEFLKERGIRLIRDKVEVDYEYCIRKNRLRLKQLFEIIRKTKRNPSIYQFLNLVLAFIQEIRYGEIPYVENNKVILNFWVPPKVLINNLGDCDSKAVTFASLWINLKNYPIILIKIPQHFLIGVAIPSVGKDRITINGLNYTLCEVSGPGKIPPGLITRYSQFYLKSGHFKYELVK